MADEGGKRPKELPWAILIGSTALLVAVIASYLAYSKAEQYEETAYDTYEHTRAEGHAAAIDVIDDICRDQPEKTEEYRCEDVYAYLETAANIDDLAAQQTVALATRGLLWIGFYQFAATALATAFVIWAIAQGHQMTAEARKTTAQAVRAADASIRSAEAAEDGAKASKTAAEAFLVIEFRAVFLDESRESVGVSVKVKNYGGSPALNVRATVQLRESSGGYTPTNPDPLGLLVAIWSPTDPINIEAGSDATSTGGVHRTEDLLPFRDSGIKVAEMAVKVTYSTIFRRTETLDAGPEFRRLRARGHRVDHFHRLYMENESWEFAEPLTAADVDGFSFDPIEGEFVSSIDEMMDRVRGQPAVTDDEESDSGERA